ncbi:MAG: hypothetical protein ACQEXN_00830 [Actinomycetota bacterium]
MTDHLPMLKGSVPDYARRTPRSLVKAPGPGNGVSGLGTAANIVMRMCLSLHRPRVVVDARKDMRMLRGAAANAPAMGTS